ncbi:MAG: outer membrane lipoprotein carrier protein LolA [Phycisphaerales bacterium]|nr:outer membrane lipoprotein carrier protein LolA [Phycisphaerales bacterium]
MTAITGLILTLATLGLSLDAGDEQASQTDVPAATIGCTLDQIESAGADLTSFTADITYRKDEALLERSDIRSGRVVFNRPEGQDGVLGIRFDTRVLGDRLEDERKRIVFENGWLIEIDEPRQLTIKRQLAHDGEHMDPMRLGGPFPLPVGQSRQAVEKRFQVQSIEPPTHRMFKQVSQTKGLTGLSLTPLPTVPEAKRWSRIDLWYDPANWLPVAVEAREVNGDVRRIRLANPQRNTPFTPDDRGVLVSQSPMDDWSVEVHPLKQPLKQPLPGSQEGPA